LKAIEKKNQNYKNTCKYETKSRKGTLVCGIKCKDDKYCIEHLKKISLKKKRKTKVKTDYKFKLSNITVRKFIEKIKIDDTKQFFIDTKMERKEILKEFIKTIDDCKYTFDDSKTEKVWTPPWCKKFPVKMFRGMINLLVQDINSSISNGNYRLNMRLKTKKDKGFYINSDQWNTPRIPFPSELKDINGFYKVGRKRVLLKSLFENIRKDKESRSYQIYHDRENGKYYLNIPVSHDWFVRLKEQTKKITYRNCENQTLSKFEIASIDPGVRTFMTVYGKNHVVEIGKNSSLTLFELLEKSDYYRSRITKKVRIKTFRKKLRKTNKRIKHLVDDLHRKTISFLTSSYNVILYPDFRVSEMIKGQKLDRKVKRRMLALRFYAFEQRLVDKCNKLNIKLIRNGEEYTTKTCSECDCPNNINREKTFICRNRECSLFNIPIDRDFNASRNFLIKTLMFLETH
jgi:transposase